MIAIVDGFDSNADEKNSPRSDPAVLSRLRKVGKCNGGWNALCPCCSPMKEPKLAILASRGKYARLICRRNQTEHTQDVILKALGLDKSALAIRDRSGPGCDFEALGKIWDNRTAYPQSRVMTELAKKFEKSLTPKRLRALAASWGIPEKFLEVFSIGYCEAREAYSIPETNSFGEIIGIQFRALDGKKRTKKGSQRGLAGLSDVIPDGTLHICEGVSDAAALRSLGFDNVIARPSATGGVDLIVQLVRQSRFESVIIIADPKPQEQDGANRLGVALAPLIDFKIVTPPDGQDARAYVNAGATRSHFDQLISCAELRGERANVIDMETLTARKIQWLWKDRIALGKLTLLAGDPGLGKSFITTYLAACVSSGKGWHDSRCPSQPKKQVLMLNAEDDPADTMLPRLVAHGADCSRIRLISGVTTQTDRGQSERMFALSRDLDKLERCLRSMPDCRLVVIDPISAYMGDKDTHKDAEVRSVLAPLGIIAAKYRVAVLAVAHLNKGDGGHAMYRVNGSIGLIAAVRAAWIVLADRQNDGRRLVLSAKNNIGPDTGNGMAYRISENNQLEWDAEVISGNAQQAMETQIADEALVTQREEAIEFLEETLSDGPVSATEIKARAKKLGIAGRTLARAKVASRVVSRRFGSGKTFGWYWRMPSDDREYSSDTSNENP